MARSVRFNVLLLSLIVGGGGGLGCDGSSPQVIEDCEGQEGCECYHNNTCEEGLVCGPDGLCVPEPPSSGGDGAGETDGEVDEGSEETTEESGSSDEGETTETGEDSTSGGTTGSDETGSDETGSDETGSDETGSDETEGGDTTGGDETGADGSTSGGTTGGTDDGAGDTTGDETTETGDETTGTGGEATGTTGGEDGNTGTETSDGGDDGPIVSEASLSVDASGCTGTDGACIVGDTLVFKWDNSSSGDGNANIGTTSQVLFDLTGVGAGMPAAGNETDGVFSYSLALSKGKIDVSKLSFAVTVADDEGVQGKSGMKEVAVTVDNQPPVITSDTITILGATGPNGTFKKGDKANVQWNNSAGGDDNVDVATVHLDFSGIGGPAEQSATDDGDGCDWAAADNYWAACYTVEEETIPNTELYLHVVDDAGNKSAMAK